jgi:TonB family protein
MVDGHNSLTCVTRPPALVPKTWIKKLGPPSSHPRSKMALIGATIIVLAEGGMAATITVSDRDGEGRVFVDVVGTIDADDFKTFKEKTDQIYPVGPGHPNKQVIVTLISNGGHAKPALLIGDWIRKRGMSTFVPGDRRCASACALIWVAGRPRNVGDNSLIGFHAIFDSKTRRETGTGNAIVGAYLRDLGLGYDAIAFMTRAGPTSVEWLTPDRAKEFRVAWAMLQPPRANPIPPQPKLQPGVHLAAPSQVPWSKSAPQQALQQPAPAPAASPKPVCLTPDGTPEPCEARLQQPAPAPPASPVPLSVADWKSQIIELIERNKRYPLLAPRDEERIVQVFFSLDRRGRVMDSRIISSSGSSVLDEEALALVQRSEPFPPPPQELKDHVNLRLPIRFNPKALVPTPQTQQPAPKNTQERIELLAFLAQKVVLYEEDPADPNGKNFFGWVIWRTETIMPGPGQPPELAISADIEVPERKLAVTWSLRRNIDKGIPATHTVEIMFKLPADFLAGGISNVPGLLMKQGEQTRGVPLAALAVKVTPAFYQIGLSNIDADKDRNLQLLNECGWFAIPVVYSNNGRAILGMEKGAPGERAFADAFKAWQN